MTEKDGASDEEESASSTPPQRRRRPRQATLIGMAVPSSEPGGAPKIVTSDTGRVPVPSVPKPPAAKPPA
ncbi:MAG TPA: hypothetical protein DEF51_56180, partial [Myxococcales bacterium]|nr:hypothetical protein [Myxococcales bacterium]